jgi:hypothetical protein
MFVSRESKNSLFYVFDSLSNLDCGQIMIYVTITFGHVTIFQINLQTLMKLVGQANYPSTWL